MSLQYKSKDLLKIQSFYSEEIKSVRKKNKKDSEILWNVLPLFDDVGILRREYAFRNYAGTYEVEVMDSKSLDDSLFLAKKSINDFINNKRTIINNNQ